MQKRRTRKGISLLIALAMAMSCLPSTAFAALESSKEIDLNQLDGDGDGYTFSGSVLTITENDALFTVRDTGSNGEIEIVIDENVTAALTLYDINSTVSNAAPITLMPGADLTLLLPDNSENTFIASTLGYASVNVPAGTKLTIGVPDGSEGTGKLTAGNGGSAIGGGAAIGGNGSAVSPESGGTIVITGGVIEAKGGNHGAGIGGGSTHPNTDFVLHITGGDVTATSESGGAGIGGGGSDGDGGNAENSAPSGNSGKIYIAGGVVTASGGAIHGGAGIGSGRGSSRTTGPTDESLIEISAGTVTAQGRVYSAGIGSGNGGEMGGTISISGGQVTASGAGNSAAIGSARGGDVSGLISISGGQVIANAANYGAAIGTGGFTSVNGELSGAISISGGHVTATSSLQGAGIGSGLRGDVTGSIEITGGTVIAACTGSGGSGIGSGLLGEMDGTITITGGDVTASSSSNLNSGTAAGIGSGGPAVSSPTIDSAPKMSGLIKITGGTVRADGGTHSAGIGSGQYGRLTGAIEITGGNVTAVGGSTGNTSGGAGIGTGRYGSLGGHIEITGGTVTATGGGNGTAGRGGAGIGLGADAVDDNSKVTITKDAVVYACARPGYYAIDAAEITGGAQLVNAYFTDGTTGLLDIKIRLQSRMVPLSLPNGYNAFAYTTGSAGDLPTKLTAVLGGDLRNIVNGDASNPDDPAGYGPHNAEYQSVTVTSASDTTDKWPVLMGAVLTDHERTLTIWFTNNISSGTEVVVYDAASSGEIGRSGYDAENGAIFHDIPVGTQNIIVKVQSYKDLPASLERPMELDDAQELILTLEKPGSPDPGPGPGGGGSSTYSVIYHSKHSSSTISDSGKEEGAAVTVKKGDIFNTPEDSLFLGWSASSGSDEVVYLPGDTFKMPARNVHLYGVYEEEEFLLNTDDHYAYVVGYPDGTVRPDDLISREEVTTIFFRLLTDEARNEFWKSTNPFSDVQTGWWSNNAISTMANANVISGYPDGAFRPQNNITRAEVAVIAAQFDDSSSGSVSRFTDVSGHWAADYINRAANRGWVFGYKDGTFRPDAYITRAEMMALVNQVLGRNPRSASDLLDGMVKWRDNADTSAWYYLHVQEATNSHYCEKDEAGTYEWWTELRPVRNWAELEQGR